MTTEDTPEETSVDAATGESAGTPSHSAPRPVPPIGLPDPGAPTGDAGTPARVSAFSRADDGETGPGRSVPSGPVPAGPVPAGPAYDATAAFPTSAPAPVGTPTSAFPINTSATQTTRIVPAGSAQSANQVPLATPDQLAGSTGGQLRTEQHGDAAREPLEEWVEAPVKRTAAHIWGILVTLLLVPVAWFLLTDGALRTFYSLQEINDRPNIAGLLSLAGGIAALVVIALVARASSLGAWIWGGVVAAAGLTVLIIPQTIVEWMIENRDAFLSVHEGFGTNLYNYLIDTGRSGLLLVFGIVVLLLALVSHASRRSGRTEGRVKAEYTARGL